MATSIADVFVQIGVNGLSAVSSALNSVKTYLSSLGTVASGALNKLAGSKGIIGGLATSLQGVLQVGAGLFQAFRALPSLMAATAPALAAIARASFQVFNYLGGDWPRKIGVAIGSAASVVKDWFHYVADSAATFFRVAANSLRGYAEEVASALGASHVAAVIRQWGALIAEAADSLLKKGALLRAALSFLGRAVVSSLADALAGIGVSLGIDKVQQKIQTAIGNVRGGMRMLSMVVSTQFQRAMSAVAAQMPQIMAALAPVIAGASRAFNGLRQVASGVGTVITSALGPVAAATLTALSAAATGVQSAVNMIGTAANTAGTAIQAMYANVVPVIGALFNMIRSGLSSLVGVARSVASAMMLPFRKLWDFVFSLRGAIAALGVSLSGAAIGKYIVEVSSDAEQAAVSFEVMLHSADKAREMLRQIQELADKTVLQLPEVRQGARSLLAMNIAARDVVPTLRMLGDISQGVQIPLNDLVQIFGKISQKNRIMGDDLRQFGRRGIPVVRELAAQFGVTTDKIYEMASNGELHFRDLKTAFERLTKEGGQFHGLMQRMSQTVPGLWSTLQDSVRAVAVSIGEAFAPGLKQALKYLIEFADWAKKAIQPFKEQIAEFSEYVASRVVPTLNALKAALPVMMQAAKTAFAVIQAAQGIADKVLSAIMSAVGGTKNLSAGLMRVLREIEFVAQQWALLLQLGKLWFEYFKTNTGTVFSTLFEDLKANLQSLGEILKSAFLIAVDVLSLGLEAAVYKAIAIAKEEAPFWLGGGKGEGDSAKRKSAEAMRLMIREAEFGAKELADLFKKMPGFNLPKLLGVDDPGIKMILDMLSRGRKLFMEEAEKEQAKKKEEEKKEDLGGAQGAMDFADKQKSKIAFTSLEEHYRQIQQSVSPHERKMEKMAEKQLAASERTAVAAEKMANMPGVQSRFA